MKAVDAFTDFSTVTIPAAETAMSRRYLDLVMRWIPVGMGYFNDWTVRPDCGHFFGGVLWYGQDTSMVIVTLAIAASSDAYDPDDAHDGATFADGKTVRELCGRCVTALPDGTAENHGFVHPSYMASSVHLGGLTAQVLQVYGADLPPHLHWHHKDCYELLKAWCDDHGAPQCVQGMDWPYLMYPNHCFFHAVGALLLRDPDASLLERRALAVVEKASAAHGGRMEPEQTVEHCHGQQDPALMRERFVCALAYSNLLHRTAGEGVAVDDAEAFEQRVSGVHLYPHGGDGTAPACSRHQQFRVAEPHHGPALHA